MSTLVIRDASGTTQYWSFTRADFAQDALTVYLCDNSGFKWKVYTPDGTYRGISP